MKSLLTIILFSASSYCFSQVGKARINITIIDTTRPYLLYIFALQCNSTIDRLTVSENGEYYFNNLKAGSYNFQFQSLVSNARKLDISNVEIIKDSIANLSITYPPLCEFIYVKNYKPKCRYNHSDKIVEIIYGYPSEKALVKAKKGLIYLGGCEISDCDPRYYCTIHKLQF